MNENLRLALIASLFSLVGQLLFFIGISIYTNEWRHMQWSFMVGMSVGVPSLILTLKRMKEQNRNHLVFCKYEKNDGGKLEENARD